MTQTQTTTQPTPANTNDYHAWKLAVLDCITEILGSLGAYGDWLLNSDTAENIAATQYLRGSRPEVVARWFLRYRLAIDLNAYYQRYFGIVENQNNWKLPTREVRCSNPEMAKRIVEAVVWFTGSRPEVVLTVEDLEYKPGGTDFVWTVKSAPGYYNATGA